VFGDMDMDLANQLRPSRGPRVEARVPVVPRGSQLSSLTVQKSSIEGSKLAFPVPLPLLLLVLVFKLIGLVNGLIITFMLNSWVPQRCLRITSMSKVYPSGLQLVLVLMRRELN